MQVQKLFTVLFCYQGLINHQTENLHFKSMCMDIQNYETSTQNIPQIFFFRESNRFQGKAQVKSSILISTWTNQMPPDAYKCLDDRTLELMCVCMYVYIDV